MTDEAPTAVLSPQTLDAGTEVTGKVTYLAPYGAMVDIGMGQDALLHISQFGRTDFRNVEDVYSVGEEIQAWVLKVDKENRVALTLEKPPALPWNRIKQNETYIGVVERIESYGAFVDIGAERPGMVHVSEMADGYIQSPNDVVSVGDRVEVRVIKLNKGKRQIDLSMKTPAEEIEQIMEPDEIIPTPMELAFRKAQKQARRERRRNNEKYDRRDDD